MGSSKIVIIGAGTFGLSTALYLLRQGEEDVTVVDAHDVPSPLSAGNDVNKILQTSSGRDFYSKLAEESLKLWRKDPVFQPALHETGIIYGATYESSREDIDVRFDYLKKRGDKVERLDLPEAYEKLVPGGKFQGWFGYYQEENCGWTFAKLALERCADECRKLGAKFITDAVEELWIELGECKGVKTASGKTIAAERTVICAGASSYKFLDFSNQLLAKCWTVGHIKLNEEEAAELRGMPVVLNLDGGFIFEPDSNNELKFCNEFPGYTNFEGELSVPLLKDAIPQEAETQMRDFLREVLPKYAEREFSVAKICWCTDTPDRHFLIGEHPEISGLVLGTGDSGQGFKYMPIVGHYIGKVTMHGDGGLDEARRNAWKWRPDMGKQRDLKALQGRSGGTNIVKDLSEVPEWTDGKSRII